MAQIIPIRDLKNTADIAKLCSSTSEPVFITKNGYGNMVLMNMEVYNQSIGRLYLHDKLKEAEEEFKSGVVGDSAEQVIARLKARHEKL